MAKMYTSRARLVLAVATAVAATSTAAVAQAIASNTALVCEAKTEVINPLPDGLELSAFSIDPINLSPACTDADGDHLNLTAVSSPATLDPKYGIHIDPAPTPGQSLVLNYTISDGRGGTTSSTLTIIRK